jgi:Fe-S-cluster-containing dehydrogenase component
MSQWNLIIDVSLCENCNNCVLAAKDELVGNDIPGFGGGMPASGRGVIHIERHTRGSGHHVDVTHVPKMCNHCHEAPCVKAGGGAVVQRPDGIVVFDPARVKGRKDLLDACPYGALVWNEDRELPQNWFFDAHLLDSGWPAPRCVSVCPTRAIEAIKVDDAAMSARVAREGLQVLKAELGTRPRVYYRHLQRVQTCFVAGSVSFRDGEGHTECLDGASVAVNQGARAIATASTDAYGDFRIDGLPPLSGAYQLAVTHPEKGSSMQHFEVGAHSVVLPDLVLGI